MVTVLLCEKREQGERIAHGLGLAPARGRFQGRWKGREMVLVWAAGHLFSAVEPAGLIEHASWNDPATLLPLPELKGAPKGFLQPSERGRKLLPGIRQALRGAEEVWLATDPDREGEAIGREILAWSGYRGPVKRLWLAGSLEPADIRRAAGNLLDGDRHRPLWRAQQARQRADWLWQLLVRAYTAAARRGLMGPVLARGRGRAGVVSVGRVQSATLAMVVERDRAIAAFRPTDHYSLQLTLAGVELPYAPARPVEPRDGVRIEDDGRPLFLDGKAMARFRDCVETAGHATITRAETGQATRHPPLPHSLTTLQRTLAREQGMSAGETLKLADRLRLNGYLTYPRTEHGHLPESLYNPADLKAMLVCCADLEPLSAPARRMIDQHVREPLASPPRCFTRRPMEHHGIIPTGKRPAWDEWSAGERAVYLEVARALVVALHPPALLDTLAVEAEVGTTDPLDRRPARFAATHARLREAGWKGALEVCPPEPPLPTLQTGTTVPIEQVIATRNRTRPPAPFTEDTLLGAMRNAGRAASGEDAQVLRAVSGIGTPATRNTVIETLLAREYIHRAGRGRSAKLRATERGFQVIEHIPRGLADVRVTARWERALDAVASSPTDARARAARDAFIAEQGEVIQRHIKEVIETMNANPDAGNTTTNPPTANMLSAARKIAASRGLTLPEGIEERFDVCRAFLDETLKQPAPPTAKMRALAERISEEDGVPLGDALDSFEACKAFLDKHLGGRKRRSAPTERMIAAAEAAARRHGKRLPQRVREDFGACRDFLERHPR